VTRSESTSDPGRNRTYDLNVRSVALYPLSYRAGESSLQSLMARVNMRAKKNISHGDGKATMMQNVIEDFRRTINESYDRLARFTEAASAEPISPGKWSRRELIGHLIDSASNNHQRFVRAQLEGRLTFPGYEQESWVERQGYKDESWADLTMLWKGYNLHLLHVISRMSGDKLDCLCAIGNGEPVTLRFLAEDYVKHLKHHLEQILS
jgi:hypothetical protein